MGKVSIIMPVFNADKYLKEAIESILTQTFKNFEFIIVNDGSVDSSEIIIKAYKDKRIKYYKNETNKGLVYTLNRAISLCNGEYIARMDSDDISLPNRLKEQVEFLEKNKEIDIVGSWVEIFEQGKISKYYKPEVNCEKIKANMFFRSELVHPSVMYRKSYLNNLTYIYDENYKACEDYELWVRTLKNYKMSNIPKVLLRYRYLYNSITRIADSYENQENRNYLHKKIYADIVSYLNFIPSEDELNIHRKISVEETIVDFYLLEKIEEYLNKLIQYNSKNNFIKNNEFKEQMGYWWYRSCRKSKNKIKGLLIYYKSNLKREYNTTLKEKIAFFKPI